MNRLLTLAPSLALALISLPKSFGLFWALVMIAGLIFLHESGHFLAAKWMGMPVETFSLGFGTRLIGFKWRETDVRLSVLPLGGYVKLAGYNPEEPDAEDPHGFLLQPFRKRMLFYSGGILANMATAFVIFYGLSVEQIRYPQPPIRVQVMSGSAAEAGGLRTGDELRHVGSFSLPEADWSDEVVPFIQRNPGTPIPVQISREGQLLQLTLSPRLDGKIGRLGIQPLPGEPSGPPRPFRISDLTNAIPVAFRATSTITMSVLQGYGRLIVGRVSIKEIGGPIAIAKAGSDAAKAGISAFLFTCAFISLNLAVLNALPIPFLDGGHMAILIFEKLRRKDLSIRLKEKILTAGFFFLASLMIFVIALDFWKMKH